MAAIPATARGPLTKRARYLQYKAQLWNERSSYEAHWRDLSLNVRPRRERFFASDRNKGDRRNQNIIDGTAGDGLRTLASGLQAGLTSPARPWFKLTTPDPDLAQRVDVKTWLHQVTQRMQIVMERSNLYNVFATAYGDYGLFGTTAIGLFADDDSGMRAVCYPIGSYAASVDGRGRLMTFIREFDWTVEQVVEEYGGADGEPLKAGETPEWERFSQATRNAYETHNLTAPVSLLHVITRNRDYEPNATDARQWPITSCTFEAGAAAVGGEDRFLRESGFRLMPVMMPRWEVCGEDTYGTDCPGMQALGDIRQLQLMQKEKGKAIQKIVNPPVTAPSHLRSQAISLLPADITYADVREGQQGIKPIHEVRIPLGELTADIMDVRARIQRAFYMDLFLMLSQDSRGVQPLTAREIDERHEEKLIALGPVLERTNDELLDPVIDRTFQLMVDAGLVPTPPADLQGVTLGVEYVSVMAQAQKVAGIAAQDRFLQSVIGLAQTWPEARHKVDPLQLVDDYADLLGVNPKLVRSTDDAIQRITQEAQANAAAQRAAQLQATASATRDLSASSLEGDTALSRLAETVTG